MATEVSCLVNESCRRNSSEILITRDLLGGLSNSSNAGSVAGREKKLDLELHLPPRPWEFQMDRRTRQKEVNFLQETDHESSSSSNLEDLELKLVPDINNNNNPISCYSYTTVCTLDKVKSALQRAENQTINNKKRTSSMVGIGIGNDSEEQMINSGRSDGGGGGVMFAAGCPGCLLYVIASKTDPKCPHCNSIVPMPSPLALPIKKARFDLNASFS